MRKLLLSLSLNLSFLSLSLSLSVREPRAAFVLFVENIFNQIESVDTLKSYLCFVEEQIWPLKVRCSRYGRKGRKTTTSASILSSLFLALRFSSTRKVYSWNVQIGRDIRSFLQTTKRETSSEIP